jgi:hypothetical protein
MNIAIDYDETYTADPALWYQFIQLAKAAGHRPFICTYRDDRYDVDETLQFLIEDDVDVVFTRGVAKKWWCEQFTKYDHVDIWVDDKPNRIYENSSLSVEGLRDWRAENGYEVAA